MGALGLKAAAQNIAGAFSAFTAPAAELAKAGVPVHETLAKVLGKTRDEVLKMGAAGEITGSALLAAFEDMTAASCKPVMVSMSNFRLAWRYDSV